MSSRAIVLTDAEKQSGLDRVRFAEGLISQLPRTHDGRNTWLMNYGVGDEAQSLRQRRGLGWDPECEAALSKNDNSLP